MDKKTAIQAANILYRIEECENVMSSIRNIINDDDLYDDKKIDKILNDTIDRLTEYIKEKDDELNKLSTEK